MLRKIVLTGVVALIPEKNAFLRLVVATLVCSCYAVGLAVAKPYKRIEDDVLAVATNLVLLLVFLGASWITLFDAIDEEAPGKADDRISDSISQRNFRIFESSLRLEPSPGLGHFHYRFDKQESDTQERAMNKQQATQRIQ